MAFARSSTKTGWNRALGAITGKAGSRDIPASRLVSWSSAPNTIDGRTIVALGKCVADGFLAFALGPRVDGFAFGVGADRGNVDEGARSELARGLGDVPGARRHGPRAMCLKAPVRLMTAVDAFDDAADGIAVGDVGPDEAELPDLAQRLEVIGVAGLPGDDPEAHIVLEQLLADVAADEAAAAEYRHEAWDRSSRCH